MIVTSVTHRPSTSILCLGLQEWVLRTARTRRDPLSAREKTTPPSLTGKGERIARRRRLDTVPGVRWKWFGGAGSECRTRARLTLTGAVSRMVPQERPRDQRAQRTVERRRSARRGGQSSRKGLPLGGGDTPFRWKGSLGQWGAPRAASPPIEGRAQMKKSQKERGGQGRNGRRAQELEERG